MKLDDARALADDLARRMAPFCHRVAVAGSVRRGVPEPRDIELVAIPRWTEEHEGLFDDLLPINELYQEQGEWIPGDLVWLKGCKPEGKYWQGLLQSRGVKLDLFLTTEEQWGAIFLIRTGSADFSHAIVTHARRVGKRFEGGWLRHADGPRIETFDEEEVFAALRLEYVEPHRRTGKEVLRTVRRVPFCKRCDSAPAVTTEASDAGPGLCVDCERLAYQRAHDQWIGSHPR